MKHLVVAVTVGLIFVMSMDGLAFRCGGNVIRRGDTKIEVLNECGEPDWLEKGYGPPPQELFPHYYYDRVVPPPRDVERWFYNLGPNRFIRILTFVEGTLVDIETGDYGY